MSSAMWDARYAASQVWDLEPSQFVAQPLQKVRRGHALDLGCGEGRHAIWLASKGWRVTAVDQSMVAISRLQGRAAVLGLEVEALVADATSYSPSPHAYDLALLAYLQLPVEGLKLVLGAAARALRVGGRLLLVAHDQSNIDQGVGGPQDPDLLTNPHVVAGMLTDLGLEVTRAEVVRRHVDSTVGFRVALDHVVDAIRP
ncbi:MAG: class I SAM-dependent methyltransferase [Propionicimonas sp.]